MNKYKNKTIFEVFIEAVLRVINSSIVRHRNCRKEKQTNIELGNALVKMFERFEI